MGKVHKRVEMDPLAYALTIPLFDAPTIAAPRIDNDPLYHAAGQARNGYFDLDTVEGDEPAELLEPPVPEVDLAAVRLEADGLIASAKSEAETLLASARAEAESLANDARSRVAGIETEAHARGFESGEKAGREAADVQMEDMLETMRGLIDVARAERVKLLEGAEPELVRLATEIAERVVQSHLALEPEAVTAIARGALQRLVARENITVRVNPADIERLRAHREAFLSSHDVESLRIVEDQRVDRGGVVIETESGTIDAKVSTQLREARRILQVEDRTTQQAS